MIVFVADMFAQQYVGGAELTTESILESSLLPVLRANSSNLNIPLMKKFKDRFWIFGNFAHLSEDCMMHAIKNLNYCVLEYDYKYCKYRSPGKHIDAEGKCDCQTSRHGKIVSMFLQQSKALWWMSENQSKSYKKAFPFLKEGRVLSSVFSDETLDYIQNLDTSNKNDKWIIMNSQSWIKGVDDAVKYAKENGLEYELLWGLEHKEFLSKLATSKGLIFLPKAGDTCPRMVIEAKLLGCELILNNNVQHKDELWFKTRETAMEYLRERTASFWSPMEQIMGQFLQIPTEQVESDIRYHIVVPCYNAERWIGRCIDSIKRQTHKNFICTMVDDMSTDKTHESIQKSVGNDSRFAIVSNQEKKYALGNIAYALERTECHLDDVVILLDGDDWFSSTNTLSRLSTEYMKEGCLLTYGSYVYFPMGTRGVEPSEYPDAVVENNTFREDEWRASHLRTFKHSLWKHLDHDDLKDEGGDYYKMAYDQAIMLPLLELAGPRSKFIPEILHVYNKNNPLNIDKSRAQEQHALAQKIRTKKSYETTLL